MTTVIDGHKLKINPQSVLAHPGSSDLLLLDFSNSHLYTVSFPLSNGTIIIHQPMYFFFEVYLKKTHEYLNSNYFIIWYLLYINI